MSLDANIKMWKHIAIASLERSKKKAAHTEYRKVNRTISKCAQEIIKNLKIIKNLNIEYDCEECRPTVH